MIANFYRHTSFEGPGNWSKAYDVILIGRTAGHTTQSPGQRDLLRGVAITTVYFPTNSVKVLRRQREHL